jgi:hypothetical protein
MDDHSQLSKAQMAKWHMQQMNAEKRRSKKETSLLLESFIDYARSRGINSTIIGVSNLIRSRSKIIKIIWILLLASSIGFCVWQIIGIIMNYLSYEVVISINYKSDATTYMPGIR